MQCEFNYPEEQFPEGDVCCFQTGLFRKSDKELPVGSCGKQLLPPAPTALPGQSERVYLGAHLDSQASRWDWHVVYLSQDFGQFLSFQLTA